VRSIERDSPAVADGLQSLIKEWSRDFVLFQLHMFFAGNGGSAGSTVANFFVTYESILPNGQIDVGNGSAGADLTTIEFDFGEPVSTETVRFATFTTVPEPPSSVLAGLAILVIAAVAWMRGLRRRLQARLS
jgi:hypothetical protein